MGRTVRLDVLGPFQAQWSDGAPLEVTGKKIQGLLGYLAVESARPHTREQVASLLWSETGDERARQNLRQALSKIRRTCGPLVASVGESFELDQEVCSLDVLDNVQSPRVRERAYQLAASQRLGDAADTQRYLSRVLERKPSFDPTRFVSALPYACDKDSEALLAALREAMGDRAHEQ